MFRQTLYILAALSSFVPTAFTQSSNEYTSNSTFKDTILSITNTYRRQHNATSLRWNETLVETSQEWSDKCEFKHSGGPYGENLSSGYSNVTESVIAWGSERKDYNFRTAEFSTKTGHFTQLVWKATTTVGCARTQCNGNQSGGKGNAPGWYVVCQYYPGGNVIGQFSENVQEKVPESERPEGPKDSRVPEDETSAAAKVGSLLGGWVLLVWTLGWGMVWVINV